MNYNYEVFYAYKTKPLTGYGKVSVIYIDVNDKSYIFKEDIDERNLISYDSEGNEYYPIEVSIEIFNMLVEGVIKMGYLKTIEENEI